MDNLPAKMALHMFCSTLKRDGHSVNSLIMGFNRLDPKEKMMFLRCLVDAQFEFSKTIKKMTPDYQELVDSICKNIRDTVHERFSDTYSP